MKGWKKWRPEEIQLLRILRAEGRTQIEISNRMGRSVSSIARAIEKHNAPLGFSLAQRRPGCGRRSPDRALYAMLLVDETLTNCEVAERCGVSRSAVHKARKLRGIHVARRRRQIPTS